jgi:hypothetical protein
VHTSGGIAGNMQLTWYDRTGKPLDKVGPPGDLTWFSLSPDGAKVALSRREPRTGLFDVWIRDLAHDNESPITFGGITEFPGNDSKHWSRLAAAGQYPHRLAARRRTSRRVAVSIHQGWKRRRGLDCTNVTSEVRHTAKRAISPSSQHEFMLTAYLFFTEYRDSQRITLQMLRFDIDSSGGSIPPRLIPENTTLSPDSLVRAFLLWRNSGDCRA